MDLYTFLDRIIGPEFTWVHIHELPDQHEVTRAFADDLLRDRKTLLLKYDVITWYILKDDNLYINVRKKEK